MIRWIIALLACATAQAATINAASRSTADIQTAINSSSNGDTVVVPAGSANWTSGQSITCSKGIILDFTGVTITRTTGTTEPLIGVTNDPTNSFELWGGTFNQTNASRIFSIGGAFSRAKFRILGTTFYSTADLVNLLSVNEAWGLIKSCSFTGEDAAEMIHNNGDSDNTTSNAGWNQTITPGSLDAVYIESCTFSKKTQSGLMTGCSAIQSYYGARTVVRYCTFNYCQIDQHGTGGAVGTRWWEIYNNAFVFPTNSDGKLMDLRAGSGVVYSNTLSLGAGSQTPHIELHEEDGGYPQLWQIGRGKDTSFPPSSGSDQALYPAYCWNNDILPTSGSANVVDGRDFYSNTNPGTFTPATYPYPWGGGSGGSTISGKITISGSASIK